jgi:hypothetical protein
MKIRQSLALGNSILSSGQLVENLTTLGTTSINQTGKNRSFSTIQTNGGKKSNFNNYSTIIQTISKNVTSMAPTRKSFQP